MPAGRPRGRPLHSLHQQDVRRKIQASQILNRLSNHVAGKVELSATQIRAAEILLRKVLPDLSAVEHTGDVTLNAFAVPLEAQSSEAWAQWVQHSLTSSGDPTPAPKLHS